MTRMNIYASEISNKLLFFDLWFKKDLDDNNANRLINELLQYIKNTLNTSAIYQNIH